MANEYVNHVMINGQNILDLRSDTVAPGSVLSGVTFHDQSGAAQSGSIQSQGAQTITPSTSAQTIAAGKYLSGAQTISAVTKELLATLDSDFIAENIKQGVDILGLIGTLSEGTPVKTGTITPSSNGVQQITHGLGQTPNKIIVINTSTSFSESKNQVTYYAVATRDNQLVFVIEEYDFPGKIATSGTNAQRLWDSQTNDTFVTRVDSAGFYTPTLKGGNEYTWYAFGSGPAPTPVPTPTQPVVSGVEFVDYDGTLVASWPTAEVAGKTALPPNPDHSSDIQWGGHTIALTSQGWNRTLAGIKSWVAAHPDYVLTVNQKYKTADNKLHLCVRMIDGRLNPSSRFKFTGTATIDWGDGTTPTAAVSNRDHAHTYAVPGDYDVAISVSAGGTLDISGVSYSVLFTKQDGSTNTNRVYNNCVRHVYLPDAVTSIGNHAFHAFQSLTSVSIPNSVTSIGTRAFNECYSLTSVAIPNSVTSIETNTFDGCSSLTNAAIPDGVTSIGNRAFNGCHSLTSVIIPNNVTSIGTYTFYQCYSLTSVSIPNNVTSIGTYTFGFCYSLVSVTIPNSVTSIDANAFNYCCGLGFIRFVPTTPPTVANANAWSNVSTDCTIYVPAASLNAYKTATNYPSPSTYTYVGY